MYMGRGGDADSKGEDGGGKIDDDEDGGEPEGEFRRVVAKELVEVEGGDGVDKGTAGDEVGLNYHWAVVW